jgi:transposase-like protein
MANPKRNREQWQELVEEWARSGLSAEAFAARHRHVHPGTLSWWRTQLRSDAGAAQGEPVSAFLAVRLASGSSDRGEDVPPSPVEVVLTTGVKLHFEHRLDPEGLRTLAVAFGGQS